MTDLDNCRVGDIQTGHSNGDYHWNECGLMLDIDDIVAKIIIDNHRKVVVPFEYKSSNFQIFYDHSLYHYIKFMILNSKKSIFIDNQYIISSKTSKNKLLKYIIKRVVRAHINNEEFSVNILTDYSQRYNPCKIRDVGLNWLLLESLNYLYDYGKIYNMNKDDVRKYIQIFELQHIDGKFIFTHNKIWIFDKETVLFGSHNISDRSYISHRDSEISITINNIKYVNSITQYYNNIFDKTIKHDLMYKKYKNVHKLLRFASIIIPVRKYV
jgi:phosphatidylserine/phosphatidylglycerophosphate/cardiolipin synthase-like enzyme